MNKYKFHTLYYEFTRTPKCLLYRTVMIHAHARFLGLVCCLSSRPPSLRAPRPSAAAIMSLQKQYMGRAFLAPSGARSGPEDELWINIGWVLTGAQKYPEYTPLFAGAISQADYEDIMSRAKAVLDKQSIPIEYVYLSYATFPCCCIGLCGCCVLQGMQTNLVQTLDQIVKEKGLGGVKFYQTATAHYSEAAVDQFGQTLVGGVNHHHISWPPMGINIVLKDRSGGQMRMAWPTGAMGMGMGMGMGMAVPGMGMPMAAVPMVEAQVVETTTTITPMEMARGGEESLADRLLKLGQLRNQGVLSEAEFETAKAAEIAKG